MATITFTITVANPGSGNKFYIDGSAGAAITFHYGVTYKFDQSDSSNAGHPLRFATAADAAGSTEYTTGVTNAGTPGSGGAYTQITSISSTTTTPLYYYCTNHSGMGGTITVATTDNYKNIQGYSVPSLSSDPSPTASYVGQVWYNSTSYTFKLASQGAAAWSSGGTLNTPLMYSGTGFGTQTAAVFAGGIPGDVTTTQTYNGTAWAASPATLNVGRHYFNCAGVGTSTAGLTFGGEVAAPPYDTTSSESFNGSTWTATNALTTSRHSICGGGLQTAAIAMGGGFGTGYSGTNVESWNGTSWTATTAAPHSKKYAMGGGTQTSAFTAGGVQYPPSIVALSTSETWNGSAWTEVGAINTARGNGGRAGGSSTDGLIFGGSPPPALAVTEQWDGSTWTEVADLGTAAASNAGTGTTSAALSIGNGAPNNGQTEEWNDPTYVVKTVTVS